MLGRGQFEVNMDTGKSQVTSKHESELQVQRLALPALGRGRRSRPTRKMIRRRKLLEICADSPASCAPRKSEAHFSHQKPSSNFAKYTPKRQDKKPYKAMEARKCRSPEVHRGYRSN